MLRFATPADSAALRGVYAQYIDTAITFEYTLPTEQECARRIAETQTAYPFLVCEEQGQIIGYACAHRYQERDAYQWNAELSIYLDQAATAKGLGRRLYRALMDILRLQGVRTVYGLVTVPNARSEMLHHAFGFSRTGIWHNAGYKCGKWHDVALFEKAIAAHDGAPDPFLPIRQIPAEQLAAILAEPA